MSQTPDHRQLRRITSGKKRRIVRSLRQQAEQHRLDMLWWPKADPVLSVRPGARVR